MTRTKNGGCQSGRIRYSAEIDTKGLPRYRADEHKALVDRWIEAVGKLPD